MANLFKSRSPWFVTPWNSFKRLREGTFLLFESDADEIGQSTQLLTPKVKHTDLYSGDRVHLMPMFLLLFAPIVHSPLLYRCIWQLIDLVTAYFVLFFTREFVRMKEVPNKRKEAEDEEAHGDDGSFVPIDEESDKMSHLAFAMYLLNPINIGCSSAYSISCFVNFLLSLTLFTTLKGCLLLSSIFLSFVVLLNPHYVVLLAPLLISSFSQGNWRKVSFTFFSFAASTAALVTYNFSMVSDASSLFDNTIGFFFSVPDLKPNVGLFWYVFIEVFPHYQRFFTWLFQLNAFIYVVPFSFLLRENWALLWVQLLIQVALFSPYPSLAEASIYIPLLFAFPSIHEYLRYPLVVWLMFVSSLVLMPTMWHLWVVAGTGNANFFFAVVLVYNLAQIFLAADLTGAYLRHDIVKRYADGDFSKLEQEYEGIELVMAGPIPASYFLATDDDKTAKKDN